jgi:hypothetical protein
MTYGDAPGQLLTGEGTSGADSYGHVAVRHRVLEAFSSSVDGESWDGPGTALSPTPITLDTRTKYHMPMPPRTTFMPVIQCTGAGARFGFAYSLWA